MICSRRLDRLVLARFAIALSCACALMVALYLLIHLSADAPRIPRKIEHLESLGHDGARGIVSYYLLLAPLVLQIVFPYAVVTSALWTLQGLRRRREFLIFQLTGVSARRSARPLFIAAVVLGALAGTARMSVLPELQFRFRELESLVKGKRSDTLRELAVLHDGSGRLVHIARYETETRVAHEVQVFETAPGGAPPRSWKRLEHRDSGPEGPGWYVGEERQALTLDPDRLRLVASRGRLLGPADLRRLALEDATRTQALLALHLLLATPFLPGALLLLAAAIWLRTHNSSPMAALALGLLIALTSFAIQSICESLGRQDLITPELAAWLPVLLPGLAGLALWREHGA